MIPERLQQLIDNLGWTQERLAKEMVTSPSTVSRWFSGNPISKTSVQRIAAVTGYSPTWLLTGEGPMKIGTTHQAEGNIIGPGAKVTAEATVEINVHEGVMMTTKVLSSKTGYANALWHNLKSFESAVDREDEMSELADEVRRLSKTVDSLREELRAVVTPCGETKKREVNGET